MMINHYIYITYIYMNHTESYIHQFLVPVFSCGFCSNTKPPGDDKWRKEEAARLLSRSALEDLGEWFQPAGGDNGDINLR